MHEDYGANYDETNYSCGEGLGEGGVEGSTHSGGEAAAVAVGKHNCWYRRCYYLV